MPDKPGKVNPREPPRAGRAGRGGGDRRHDAELRREVWRLVLQLALAWTIKNDQAETDLFHNLDLQDQVEELLKKGTES